MMSSARYDQAPLSPEEKAVSKLPFLQDVDFDVAIEVLDDVDRLAAASDNPGDVGTMFLVRTVDTLKLPSPEDPRKLISYPAVRYDLSLIDKLKAPIAIYEPIRDTEEKPQGAPDLGGVPRVVIRNSDEPRFISWELLIFDEPNVQEAIFASIEDLGEEGIVDILSDMEDAVNRITIRA